MSRPTRQDPAAQYPPVITARNQSIKNTLFAIALVAWSGCALAQTNLPITVDVPGIAAIWLAGQPDGTQSPAALPGQETAPQNSPVLIRLPILPAATGLQFSVTGGTNIAVCCGPLVGADGYIGSDHPPYGELTNYFNLSIIMAPQASLIGVFLNSQKTYPTPGGLSFVDPSSATGQTIELLPNFTGGNYSLSFSTLAPQLQQIFFIGYGLTGTGTGNIQQFFVPAGADELFLATLDQGNFDNVGALQVTVSTPVPLPAALLASLLTEVTGVGPGRSLADKGELAQTYYAAKDIQATCAVLTGFVNEVHAQAGKKIDPTLDAKLIADAQSIEAAIGCN